MKDRSLSPEIVTLISQRTGKKKGTVEKDIYVLRRSYSGLPINSVAQIYALENYTSVLRKLTKHEKEMLPNLDIVKPPKVLQKKTKPRKEEIIEFVHYHSTDPFIQAHIEETNRAYTYRCYTAAFILCRKILENLLADIIRKRYPSQSRNDVELYFDTSQNRTKDFSIILRNLASRADDFGPEKKLLLRVIQLSGRFKDDANDKAHSWYHIVRSKREIDETNFQDIIDMIELLESGQFPPKASS